MAIVEFDKATELFNGGDKIVHAMLGTVTLWPPWIVSGDGWWVELQEKQPGVAVLTGHGTGYPQFVVVKNSSSSPFLSPYEYHYADPNVELYLSNDRGTQGGAYVVKKTMTAVLSDFHVNVDAFIKWASDYSATYDASVPIPEYKVPAGRTITFSSPTVALAPDVDSYKITNPDGSDYAGGAMVDDGFLANGTNAQARYGGQWAPNSNQKVGDVVVVWVDWLDVGAAKITFI